MAKFTIMITIFSTFLGSCKVQHQPLQTVASVDLERYAGLWYEIAAFPQVFEKSCRCTTAEYKITGKNYITVINKCQKPGKFAKIEGKAFVIGGSGNAKLKVQFFWPFRGDYWIIELDDNYQWAAVGTENRKYLWVLCRKPFIEDYLYNEILNRLSKKGFDVSKLNKTIHDCK